MIRITEDQLRPLIAAAYNMSRLVGMGFLHAKEGPLSDAEIELIVKPTGNFAANMDYVHGRQVKMTVFRDADGLSIRGEWYDHTNSQFARLLDEVGVTP